MKTTNIFIVILLIAGMMGLVLVEGIIKPGRARQEQQYILEQQDPLTHDFSRTLRFRNRYMGNLSNLSNLNATLPLAGIERSYQLHPERLTAEIFYKETLFYIDEGLFRRALVYNATANFALIENLETLVLHFPGKTFTVTREAVNRWYGTEVSALQDEALWEQAVQSKLSDRAYVESFVQENFIEE